MSSPEILLLVAAVDWYAIISMMSIARWGYMMHVPILSLAKEEEDDLWPGMVSIVRAH
jgi:hypothetical protein